MLTFDDGELVFAREAAEVAQETVTVHHVPPSDGITPSPDTFLESCIIS